MKSFPVQKQGNVIRNKKKSDEELRWNINPHMTLNTVQSPHETKTGKKQRNMVPWKNAQDILDGAHDKRRRLQENENKNDYCTKNQTRGVENRNIIWYSQKIPNSLRTEGSGTLPNELRELMEEWMLEAWQISRTC